MITHRSRIRASGSNGECPPTNGRIVHSMAIVKNTSDRYALLICGIAALGGFIFSFDNSAFGGSQILFRDYFHLTPILFGLTFSSGVFGCMLAPIPGALLCEAWGSKRMMLLAAILLIIGAAGAALALDVRFLVGARVVSGLGAGLASLACPMYIAEVAPPARRGALGLLFQIAIMIGSLCGIVLAWGLISLLPAASAWRWIVASGTFCYLTFALLASRLPQSPRWLVRQQREAEAREVLARIDGPSAVDEVLQGIRDSLQTGNAFRSLLRPEFRWPLITGVLLALFNSWTGWSLIGSYLPTLLQKVGYARAGDAVGLTIVPTAIGLGFTFLTVLVIDRVGRRPLWIGGSAAMAILLTAMGFLFLRGIHGWPVLLVVLGLMLVHTTSVGPIPWLMIPEVVPNAVRAPAMSICTTCLWLAFFSGALVFPNGMALSEQHIGSPALVFWILAGICVLSFLFGWLVLPETKGMTLEQIGNRYKDDASQAIS